MEDYSLNWNIKNLILDTGNIIDERFRIKKKQKTRKEG